MTKDEKKLRVEVKERTKDNPNQTPLLYAVNKRFPLDAIHRLCEAGSDINAEDGGRFTPIMYSVLNCYCDIFDYLATTTKFLFYINYFVRLKNFDFL